MTGLSAAADRPRLSVVVPVYNERDNIQPLVDEIVAIGGCGDRYEIVYVDDASDDGTADVLEELRASGDIPLRVVTHAHRQGQSAAIVNGVRAANAAWIATLDGDGQNNPADICGLLDRVVDAHAQDPDVVCIAGIRVKRQDSVVRKMSSRIANSVRQGILKDGVEDTGCGLKVFRRDAFLALPHFDHVHRYIPALFQMCGGRVITGAVSHRPRERGTSKYGISNRLFVGIVDLAGVSWLRRRAINRPWGVH